jgi:hypothetical protein
MDGAEQGFLIVYEFEDDDRPLIIEDDGQACFAHVRGPTGKIVTGSGCTTGLQLPRLQIRALTHWSGAKSLFRRPAQIFACRFRSQLTSLRYSVCSFEASYLQYFASGRK